MVPTSLGTSNTTARTSANHGPTGIPQYTPAMTEDAGMLTVYV